MPIGRLNNYKIVIVDLSDDTTVTHVPTAISVTLRPSEGFVYEVIDFGYNAPTPGGSGAGTHGLIVKYTGAYSHLIQIAQAFGASLRIRYDGFTGTAEVPVNIADQYNLMQGGRICVSNDVPLDIEYTNTTDADQAGTRTCILVCKMNPEAI